MLMSNPGVKTAYIVHVPILFTSGVGMFVGEDQIFLRNGHILSMLRKVTTHIEHTT